MYLQTSPAVTLMPPTEVTRYAWCADHILNRNRYRLSSLSAALLVLACKPRPAGQLRDAVAERSGCGGADFAVAADDAISKLREPRLLVTEREMREDARLRWLMRLRSEWRDKGWVEAAEYHALTFDYPCLDYLTGQGWLADRARMRSYYGSEPDTFRAKADYADRPLTPLPAPAADMLPLTARDLWTGASAARPLDRGALVTITSLAFGLTGQIKPPPPSAPIFLKASPSGGSRHPTEGYLVVRDVPGMTPGWYHISLLPSFGLRQLGLAPTGDGQAAWLFPSTVARAGLGFRAAIVITSCFDRNMYRYREPRTFRTVHMDAGHVAATVCLSARSLGVSSVITTADAGPRIEEHIGLDPMREGYMLTVALGASTSSH